MKKGQALPEKAVDYDWVRQYLAESEFTDRTGELQRLYALGQKTEASGRKATSLLDKLRGVYLFASKYDGSGRAGDHVVFFHSRIAPSLRFHIQGTVGGEFVGLEVPEEYEEDLKRARVKASEIERHFLKTNVKRSDRGSRASRLAAGRKAVGAKSKSVKQLHESEENLQPGKNRSSVFGRRR